jgi:hypothetical protein
MKTKPLTKTFCSVSSKIVQALDDTARHGGSQNDTTSEPE